MTFDFSNFKLNNFLVYQGAACGFFCAISTTATMSIGGRIYGVREGAGMDVVPPSVSNCINFTATTSAAITVENIPFRFKFWKLFLNFSFFILFRISKPDQLWTKIMLKLKI